MTEDVVGDEYITNIAGSVSFATTKFSVNPGLAATFPEGSVKATLFTEWRMKSCVFYYRPAVSGFATQGQSGRVVLSMDYNAANATPTTQQQVEVMPHRDGMPFENIELPLDARYVNRADSKYIRTGALGISEDVKTYDGGNLWVSTYGQANTNQVGELRVRYVLTCSMPTLLNTGAATATQQAAFFQSVSAGETGATNNVQKNLALATATYNGIGAVNTAGSIVPLAGVYLATMTVTGQFSGAATLLSMFFSKNGSVVHTGPGNNLTVVPVATAGASSISASAIVTANGTDAFILSGEGTFSTGTLTLWGDLTLLAI